MTDYTKLRGLPPGKLQRMYMDDMKIEKKKRREGTVPASKLLDILMQTCGEEHGREKFNELIGDMIEEQEENEKCQN